MLKQICKTLLVLTFASSAFAQNGVSTDETSKTEPTKDQFSEWLMKGFNASFALASMNAALHYKIKDNTGFTETFDSRTDKGAAAVGISAMFSEVRRDSFGWSAGASLIHKTDNNAESSDASLSNFKELTQLRPEGNLIYAFTSGFYVGGGGHLSILSGASDYAAPVGFGIQASVGFVPTKNLGFDLGYYVTIHKLSDDLKKSMEVNGNSVQDSESYIAFGQLGARATYYF